MYATGSITGNTIDVEMVSTDRVPQGALLPGQTCLLVERLAGYGFRNPEPCDVLGVYADPNGAKFAIAAKTK